MASPAYSITWPAGAVGADLRDHRQNQVFGGHACAEFAGKSHQHRFWASFAPGIAWPERAPPRTCRCRRRARRTLHACWCGCHRRRSSCRAASVPVPGQSRARFPAPVRPDQTTERQTRGSSGAAPPPACAPAHHPDTMRFAGGGNVVVQRGKRKLRTADSAPRQRAVRQTPAARSLHAPDADRYKEWTSLPARRRPGGGPRSCRIECVLSFWSALIPPW